jgi:hypothetical protein
MFRKRRHITLHEELKIHDIDLHFLQNSTIADFALSEHRISGIIPCWRVPLPRALRDQSETKLKPGRIASSVSSILLNKVNCRLLRALYHLAQML